MRRRACLALFALLVACAPTRGALPTSEEAYAAYLEEELRQIEAVFFWWSGLLLEWERLPEAKALWQQHVDRPLADMREQAWQHQAPECYREVHRLWREALDAYVQASAALLRDEFDVFMRATLQGHAVYLQMGGLYVERKQHGCS